MGTGLNRDILRNVNPGEERGSQTQLLPAAITLLRRNMTVLYND